MGYELFQYTIIDTLINYFILIVGSSFTPFLRAPPPPPPPSEEKFGDAVTGV